MARGRGHPAGMGGSWGSSGVVPGHWGSPTRQRSSVLVLYWRCKGRVGVHLPNVGVPAHIWGPGFGEGSFGGF